MTRTFREAFIEALQRTGWSINRVADAAGVSADQLKKLNQGRSLSTNVDDAVKVAHAFGYTLDEFINDDLAKVRSDVASLYSQLSDAERQILRDAARGRAARGQAEEP
ncbi:hypothetical protein GQF56_16250 [Rhodobacter sphaeroides]|jgi:Helix-turn-helix.|uniref:helix-turn-helix domain-containing protein n=1 Tax=Cereibacter sphaeroides TaxID=1063 RepID=UPI001366513A|nr:helix-turn-helix transcriptional regulator [Cereibacter sphaeroides]MVX49403.1 hypothetical protein [Cereibacter sphaeroides]